jgi:hypothetical protein
MDTEKIVDSLRHGNNVSSNYRFLINLAKWFEKNLPCQPIIWKLKEIAKKINPTHRKEINRDT